jgi:hypothetical protein
MNATTVYVSVTMARRRSEAEPDGHGWAAKAIFYLLLLFAASLILRYHGTDHE